MRLKTFLVALALGVSTPLAVAVAAPKPAAAAQTITPAWLAGVWRFTWQGAQGNYVGGITFTQTGEATEAVVEVLRPSDSARVKEKARVVIVGANLQVDGYEVIDGNVTNWSPDNFYLSRAGERLTGYSVDDSGNRGTKIEVFR